MRPARTSRRSPRARDNIERTEAGRLAGCRIYHIPKDFSACETAENALWRVPEQEAPTLAVWSGFIPSRERYKAIYQELLRKRIYLPNTPAQHLVALEFDRAMSYYIRYVVTDDRPVTLPGLEQALRQVDDRTEAALAPLWEWLLANREGLLAREAGSFTTRGGELE